MATRTICDVKSCQKSIEAPSQIPHVVTIAAKTYELCQECFDGLNKFIGENLLEGQPVAKTVDMNEIFKGIKLPNYPSPNIQINPAQPVKWRQGVQTIPNGVDYYKMTHYYDPKLQSVIVTSTKDPQYYDINTNGLGLFGAVNGDNQE